jgi:hypothetical protein
VTDIDQRRRPEREEILLPVDALLGPVANDNADDEAHRLELFRQRFVNTLIDLEIPAACGVTVAIDKNRIVIRTKDRRAAEVLLRVLERHADHHPFGDWHP